MHDSRFGSNDHYEYNRINHDRYLAFKAKYPEMRVFAIFESDDPEYYEVFDQDAFTLVSKFYEQRLQISHYGYKGEEQVYVVSFHYSKLKEYKREMEMAGYKVKINPEVLDGFGAVRKKARGQKAITPVVKNKERSARIENTGNIEKLSEEIYFIRRFVNLIGREKTKDQILKFIHAIQKAIKERRLRKASPRAKDIEMIQDWAVQFYNSMKGNKGILKITEERKERLKNYVEKESVYVSIKFMKKYILLNGQEGRDAKLAAKALLEKVNDSLNEGLITKKDPYYNDILRIKAKLAHFSSAKGGRVLQIEKQTLKGLEGIVEGMEDDALEGPDDEYIMNSVDFAGMEFETIGLQGKWRELIGDPSSNFTAMVYGKPKMGKSYLCVDFAGYLARNHGRVLHVAREEGLNGTLQQKLHDKDVIHPNLTVSSYVPSNLNNYDFVFLDSVNSLGMNVDDVRRLKERNPKTSFIFVFQTTKNGNFRGPNTFQHFVDIVIEVPEKGFAVQNGRFNQGGEMRIFEDYSPN